MTGPRYRNNVFQHVLRGGPAGGGCEIFETPVGNAVGHSADFRTHLDAGYTMAVLSNYGSGAPPVSQKIQNLVGKKE